MLTMHYYFGTLDRESLVFKLEAPFPFQLKVVGQHGSASKSSSPEDERGSEGKRLVLEVMRPIED